MNEKYEDFFQKAEKIQKEIELKKLRGLNDFNIFTTLLNVHDEVRVHSRFIHALLDVKGKHYQKELFLELFIKICKLQSFGLLAKDTLAYTEYKNIDIYLTDGDKHIIIENKIYTAEQKNQIERYVRKIAKKDISGDKIYILYLSKNIQYPSEYSLGGFEICENGCALEYKGTDTNLVNLGKINFKSIHYDQEILNWLDVCLREISNLTNLRVIITQYKNTINLLYGKYIGVEMELEELVRNNYEISKKVSKEYKKLKFNIKKDFMNTISEKLKLEYNIYNDEKSFFINICKNEWKSNKYYLYYRFELWNNNIPHISILPNDIKINVKNIRENIDDKEALKHPTNQKQFDWDYLLTHQTNEFEAYLLENSQKEKIIEEVYEAIIKYINSSIKMVSNINKNIEAYM